MTPLPFKVIAQAALDRADTLVPSWLPDGKRQGDEWISPNPKRPGDKKAGSFSVNMKTGVWKEFAGDDAGADLVSLFAYLFTDGSQKEAALDLGKEFGIETHQRPEAPRKPATPCPAPPVPPTASAPPERHPSLRMHTGEWIYRDTQGGEIYRVRRYDTPDGKEYRPLMFKDGKWTWAYPSEPRPLYGLDRLVDRNKSIVLVVEGEKTADAAARLFPSAAVVTSPAGAKASGKADWTPLRGHDVVIWRDNDQAGLEYAGEVHSHLQALGIVARVVEVPKTWPAKWDHADPAPAGVTPADLQDLIRDAQPWGSEKADDSPLPPLRVINTSEWGIRTPPPLLWVLAGAVPQGQPGIWAGRSNAGKSLGAIQLGHNVALGHGLWGLPGPVGPMFTLYVSMEDGEEELERRWARSLAITSEDFPDWSRDHVHQIQQNFRPLLPDWKSPSAKTLPHLVDTIKRVWDTRPAASLPGLILVDTLAAVGEGEENTAEAQRALWGAFHDLTDATGATVVALHHSKKPMGAKPPTMSDRMSFDFIRGSSAIVAGARFVLQMEPILRAEAEQLGLDGDRAAAGNFPILGLSKQVSGPKGEWYLLQQRQAHEQGGGFFTPHPDAAAIVASLKGGNAVKKLNVMEGVLVDLHSGIHDRGELIRRNWPDMNPEDGETKLKRTLSDMRRGTRGWLQAGKMDLTATGFLKAQALGMAQELKTGNTSNPVSNLDEEGLSNDAA